MTVHLHYVHNYELCMIKLWQWQEQMFTQRIITTFMWFLFVCTAAPNS